MKQYVLGVVTAMILGTTSSLAHPHGRHNAGCYNRCPQVTVVKKCDGHCGNKCDRHRKVSHKGYTRPVKNCACSTCNKLRRKAAKLHNGHHAAVTWRGTLVAYNTVAPRR